MCAGMMEDERMSADRCALLKCLLYGVSLFSLPAYSQVVVATLPVGNYPGAAAVNSATNTVYVVNEICSAFICQNPGTVTRLST